MKAARHRFACFAAVLIKPSDGEHGFSGAQSLPNRCQRGSWSICGKGERLAFRWLDAETIRFSIRHRVEVKRRRELELHGTLIPKRHAFPHWYRTCLDGSLAQSGIDEDHLLRHRVRQGGSKAGKRCQG
ncbi:MAG: hypothetical protein ACK5ZM_01630 [bacterium]